MPSVQPALLPSVMPGMPSVQPEATITLPVTCPTNVSGDPQQIPEEHLDYHKIWQLILGNSTIMQETSVQLVEVNQTRLNQWHNRRVKKQDGLVLQGIDLPSWV
ncbi:hypothetical protein SRHO_G00235280 [Serrasalmus rhombeus]